MRKVALAVLALVVAACRSPQPKGPQTGASSARGAVDAIMSALKAGDIQTVSTIWGTARGPARDDDRFSRTELEQRIVLMTRCFRHDSYQIVTPVAGENGGQGFQVDLRRGAQTRRTRVNAVESKSERWYVDVLDVDPVRDFCREQPGGAPGSRRP